MKDSMYCNKDLFGALQPVVPIVGDCVWFFFHCNTVHTMPRKKITIKITTMAHIPNNGPHYDGRRTAGAEVVVLPVP